jgi:hypothetical protein
LWRREWKWNAILVEALTMEVVMEVTEVLSVGLGKAGAGSTAGSEDAEASDSGWVACRASTLLSSSALVSGSEGEEEGMVVERGGDGREGRMVVEVAEETEWVRRMSRDWVTNCSP